MPRRIRVISPYVGGAFGGKGSLFTWTSLVAAAARSLGRPVKLVVTRQQGFTTASFRAETRQRFRLGAGRDGRFTGFEHSGAEISSRAAKYVVNGAESTSRMYHADAVRTGVTCVHADRQTPGFMRAPPETPYFFALESGVDELARQLNMDPVELRRANDIEAEPVNGVPYTSRSLMECYDAAGRSVRLVPLRSCDRRLHGRRRSGRLGLRDRGLPHPDGAVRGSGALRRHR